MNTEAPLDVLRVGEPGYFHMFLLHLDHFLDAGLTIPYTVKHLRVCKAALLGQATLLQTASL
jgi:hypothetical protein